MPKRNLAWILVVITIAFLMWKLPQTIAVRDSVYEVFGPLVEVRAEIRNRFVENVDDTKLVDTAINAGIKAMVKELHDPHAVYLPREEYERFRKQTDGTFGGVGVDVWATDDGLEVLSREPESQAAKAGILPGEIITHVDGQPTKGVPLVEAVNSMLGGPPGTEVTLTILSRNPVTGPAIRELRLRREIIRLDPVQGWSRTPTGEVRFMLEPEAGIGYLRLTKFTADAAERMDAEVSELRRHNLRGLILDLRDNTGGLFDSGIAVADRFIEEGLLVRQSGRKTDEKEWYATHEGNYPNFEMAVLVNASTASAAELVAGALRDHHRAAIIGERTYGKGCVQEVIQLEHGGGALKLTTAYYYLPSGQCIHRTPEAVARGHWGVEPTIPVPLSEAQRERWLATRREVTREALPDSASQPATASAPADEELDRQADAETILDADLQLRTAVEYLEEKLGVTAKPPADSEPSGIAGLPATRPAVEASPAATAPRPHD